MPFIVVILTYLLCKATNVFDSFKAIIVQTNVNQCKKVALMAIRIRIQNSLLLFVNNTIES